MRSIAINGKGGDGAQMLAKIIANAALLQNLHVSCYPIYDAAKRNGESSARIKVSDEKIINLVVDEPEIIIDLSGSSLIVGGDSVNMDKYKLPNDKKLLGIMITGILLKKIGLIKEKCFEDAIKNCVPKKFLKDNLL